MRAGAPQPPPLLTSTQDLISRFNLLTAYDKFVRPFAAPVDGQSSNHPPTPAPAAMATAPAQDKGKGREREPETPFPANAPTPGAQPDADDDDGKDGKKKRNSYKHLIKGIPGASVPPSLIPDVDPRHRRPQAVTR